MGKSKELNSETERRQRLTEMQIRSRRIKPTIAQAPVALDARREGVNHKCTKREFSNTIDVKQHAHWASRIQRIIHAIYLVAFFALKFGRCVFKTCVSCVCVFLHFCICDIFTE